MKSDLATIEKYPVITPSAIADSEKVMRFYLLSLTTLVMLWVVFSIGTGFCVEVQAFFLVIGLVLYLAKHNAADGNNFMRSKLELKAKGLDIKAPSMYSVMPWDWLTKVEIRQRSFDIIPNYVYFKFKNNSDVLILWDDVKKDMDSTTLVSCVRTWAPRAEIKGDAKLAKSESIATYTELWLRDLSSTKERLRQDQVLSVGTVLSDSYKIERILSGGGQGTAYEASVLPTADFAALPPQVVIKEFILPANDRGLQKAKDSLTKEVTILRRIEHPLIIRLFDFFIEDMRGYLVIEYVDGVSLRQLVERGELPTEPSVVKIGLALCEALIYLHGLKPPIIHGDVTPDNVMLEKSGQVKLLDFDAAQELTRNKTNTVVGKHAYMSPEQFKGVLGESSDIYALGCTLHFLLTGSDPEPISESRPRKINQNVSEAMNEVVSKATKLDQAQRFTTLQELRAQLGKL